MVCQSFDGFWCLDSDSLFWHLFRGGGGLISDNPIMALLPGLLLFGAATLLRRTQSHLFWVKLALAISTLAHGLILIDAANLWGGEMAGGSVAIASILLCLVLYPLYDDDSHRFLSCLLAVVCLSVWMLINDFWPLIHLELLVELILLSVVFMYRPNLWVLRPLGCAMAIAVPGTLMLTLLPADQFSAVGWPAKVVLTLCLIWLYQWLAGGWKAFRSEPMVIAVLAAVCLAAVTTPEVLAALGL
ncbi:MAG: DUF4401 domain-containing protein [Pirellulaceae bacterium]|nr:DUF4401 domain-containing protein [Pirellulaceae bacterium]